MFKSLHICQHFRGLTRAAIFMKSMFPPERKPVSMKLGTLPPPLPPSSPTPAKPWAGNPKGNPGKPFVFCPDIGNPAMKLKGEPPRPASPSSPRPESREAVPLAGRPRVTNSFQFIITKRQNCQGRQGAAIRSHSLALSQGCHECEL